MPDATYNTWEGATTDFKIVFDVITKMQIRIKEKKTSGTKYPVFIVDGSNIFCDKDPKHWNHDFVNRVARDPIQTRTGLPPDQ